MAALGSQYSRREVKSQFGRRFGRIIFINPKDLHSSASHRIHPKGAEFYLGDTEMNVNEEEVKNYLGKWKKILRLRDWDIAIKIVKTKWRKSGDIKIDLEDKKACILVNHFPKCQNLEELVIHELLHLKLYGMDQMIEDLLSVVFGEKEQDPKREFAYTQFMVLLESTIEDLTKGYLAAVGSQKSLSFGRLQEAIDEELGNNRKQ